MHTSSVRALLFSFGLITHVTALPSISLRDANPAGPQIEWSECPDLKIPNLDCGQIKVPINYDKPDGDTVTLAMARLKANGTTRKGCLLYNPGGPGDPASAAVIETAQGTAPQFSTALIESYDIIGLDPRGVGQSSPVKCDYTLFNKRVTVAPTRDEEFQELVDANKAFEESCRNQTGPLFDHLDTIHYAKDVELVRKALNEDKLNFLGQSYGTNLGAAYAELYPENVGRMVLDAIFDHSQSEIATIASAAVTLELTLNKWFVWCNSSDQCTLKGKDAPAMLQTLIEQANQTPIPNPAGDGQTVRNDTNGEDILLALDSYLGTQEEWPVLGRAIEEAQNGNASLFPSLLANESTNPAFSAIAIGAQDFPQSSKNLTDLLYKEQMIITLAPHTLGISRTWFLLAKIIGWSTQLTNPPHTLDPRIKEAPPILLAQSLFDPQTSIDWANNVRLQIPNSVLIVRTGGGHTSYQTFNQTSQAMDAFLINGTLPKQDSTYES